MKFRKILSLITIAALLLMLVPFNMAQASNYSFEQSSWTSDATPPPTTITHGFSGNRTKYDDASADLNLTTPTEVKLGTTSSSVTQTTDAHFNGGSKSQVTVGSNSVALSLNPTSPTLTQTNDDSPYDDTTTPKPTYLTGSFKNRGNSPFTASGMSNTTTSGSGAGTSVILTQNTNWISGYCGTYIYNADVSGTKQWKTTDTNCDTPQCGQDGGQNGDNLVASNTPDFAGLTNDLGGNPNNYPARQACKNIGGRLPTLTELQCINNNCTSLGSFPGIVYWSATETGTEYTYFLWKCSSEGGWADLKTYAASVRCVRDTAAYNSPGTYTSYVDSGNAISRIWNYFNFYKNSSSGSGTTTLRVQVASSDNNTTTPSFPTGGSCDQTVTTDAQTSNFDISGGCAGTKKYLWYQVTLTASSDQSRSPLFDQFQANVTNSNYYSTGTYTSGRVDIGENTSFANLGWGTTQTANTEIKLKVKSYATDPGTPDFTGCNDLVTINSGNADSSLALSNSNCVTNGHPYIFYQATLNTSNTTETPSLDDLTFNFNKYATGQTLTSLPFNSTSKRDAIAKINVKGTLGASGTAMKVQVRSAATEGGLTSAQWCGSTSCNGTDYFNFTSPNADPGQTLNVSDSHPLKNDGDDQWFQYRIILDSSGAYTPTLESVALFYEFITFVGTQTNWGSGVSSNDAVHPLSNNSPNDWRYYTSKSSDMDVVNGGADLEVAKTQDSLLVTYNSSAVNTGFNYNTPTLSQTEVLPAGTGGEDARVGLAMAPPSGIWVAYKLDETSGNTAYDSSGNGRNSAINGSPAWVSGKINNGLQFNGSNVYMYCYLGCSSYRLYPTNYTLEMWAKPSIVNSTRKDLYDGEGAYNAHLIIDSDNTFKFTRDGGGAVVSGVTAIAGQWYHLVVTFDGSKIARIYINGDLKNTGVAPTQNETWNYTSIGSGYYGGNYFSGIIDELVIYNRQLTSPEVSTRYNSDQGRPANTGTQFYSTGTFTSGIIDPHGGVVPDWGQFSWNANLNGQNLTMEVRSCDAGDSDCSEASAWGGCTVTSGADISPHDCVDDGDRYIQYRANMSGNTTATPELLDVTIGYNYYPTSAQNIISSAFNSTSAGNRIDELSWNETVPANTSVKVYLKSAADPKTNLTGATEYEFTNATSGCSKSGTTVTCPVDALNDALKDGSSDQWFQYKVTLQTTDGLATPTFSDIYIGYNADVSKIMVKFRNFIRSFGTIKMR